MARKTEYLELHLPDKNEFYDVEKDQNKNFEKLDEKIKEMDTFKKKSGFNLDKSDNYVLNDTSTLLTTKGSNDLYEVLLKTIKTLCPYKIGDIYITTNSQNPAVTWIGTEWEKIEGRFLRATDIGQEAGLFISSDTRNLTLTNLPPHSHGITINAAGNHTHTQVSHNHTQPAHKHSLSVELVAEQGYKLSQSVSNGNSQKEANLTWTTNSAGGENTGTAAPAIHANGNHTHSATISNTGSGSAFDIKPAYYTVHIWKRIG